MGRSMRQRVFVVNDLVPPLRDVTVEWNISTTAAEVNNGVFLTETIPGNSLTRVGVIEYTPPDRFVGSDLVISLAMKSEGISISENMYSVTITAVGDQRELKKSSRSEAHAPVVE